MKDEILGGMRNALERGEPMEKVIQTFVNAGYNADQVKEVANSLSTQTGSILNVKASSTPINPKDPKQATPDPKDAKPTTPAAKPATPGAPMPVTKPSTPSTTTPPANQQVKPPVQPLKPQQMPQQPNQLPKKGSKKTVIILSVVLFLLVVGLILTVMFSDQIIDKFS